MMMGQSCTGSEFSPKDALYHINPLILRQSAIFGDVPSGKLTNYWVEQGGGSDWTAIEVSDIDVVRFAE